MSDKDVPTTLPDQDRLVEIYQKALKDGNNRVADLTLEAIRSTIKGESIAIEARRLAALANEL